MTVIRRAVVVVAVSVLLPALLQGQDQSTARSDTAGLTFDFQDADLAAVLSTLAESAGLNIVYTDLPDRSVTLRTARPVAPARVRDLLESVARANGLTIDQEAGVLRIHQPEKSAGPGEGARQEGGTLPVRETAPPRLFVHHLDHADAESVAQTLRSLFGLGALPGGVGRRREPTSLSEGLREQSESDYRAYRPSDRQRRGRRDVGRAVEPRNWESRDASDADQGDDEHGVRVTLQGPVQIVPEPRTNAVLVLASSADYETIEGAIQELDVRPLQVLIEVLIAEVRQDDDFALGTTVEVPVGDDEEGVGFELQGLSAGDVALRVLGIGDVGASAVLSALSTTSEVRIISRPIVMAQNNEEARILVGDQRPFVQLQRSLPTDQDVRDQVVQYRNVGTELTIFPTINRDGYVNLSVLQEVSDATAEVQFGAPIISTRETETDVLVKDGHTVVLGGLVDHQTEEIRSGIPLLKDIPILGALFGSTQEREVATELFILLTPHVLRSDEQIESVRQRLQRSTDALREQMPEAPSLLGPTGPGQEDDRELPSPDTVPRLPEAIRDTLHRAPLPSPDTVGVRDERSDDLRSP